MVKTKQKFSHQRVVLWRVVCSVLLIAITIYILLMHRAVASASIHAAMHADIHWLGLAIVLLAATFLLASLLYVLLALHSLRYTETFFVQIAAAFTGRLLPAGLGGLGLNGLYLYRRGHTVAEATAVVSVNNLIGITAHMLLLVMVLLVDPHVAERLFGNRVHLSWGVVLGLLTVFLLASLFPTLRKLLIRFGRNLFESIRKERVGKLLIALLFASLLTTCYTLLLLSTARAVGISLGMLQIFIVFSTGMLAGTVTPTPGGLVGAEAGLLGGFIACGVSSAQAGAAVILFRLITYWLPVVPGMFALLVVRARRLL